MSNCNQNSPGPLGHLVNSFLVGGRQGPGGTLPEDIPANVVTFAFEGTACFTQETPLTVYSALLGIESFFSKFDCAYASAQPYNVYYMDPNTGHVTHGSLSGLVDAVLPHLNCFDDGICNDPPGYLLTKHTDVYRGTPFNTVLQQQRPQLLSFGSDITDAPNGSLMYRSGGDWGYINPDDLFQVPQLPPLLNCLDPNLCNAADGDMLRYNRTTGLYSPAPFPDLPDPFTYGDLDFAEDPRTAPRNAVFVNDGTQWQQQEQDGFAATGIDGSSQSLSVSPGAGSSINTLDLTGFSEVYDLNGGFDPSTGRFTNNTGSTQCYDIMASAEIIVVSGLLTGKAQLRLSSSLNLNKLYLGSESGQVGAGIPGEPLGVGDLGISLSGAGTVELAPGESIWLNVRLNTETNDSTTVTVPGFALKFSAEKKNLYK